MHIKSIAWRWIAFNIGRGVSGILRFKLAKNSTFLLFEICNMRFYLLFLRIWLRRTNHNFKLWSLMPFLVFITCRSLLLNFIGKPLRRATALDPRYSGIEEVNLRSPIELQPRLPNLHILILICEFEGIFLWLRSALAFDHLHAINDQQELSSFSAELFGRDIYNLNKKISHKNEKLFRRKSQKHRRVWNFWSIYTWMNKSNSLKHYNLIANLCQISM